MGGGEEGRGGVDFNTVQVTNTVTSLISSRSKMQIAVSLLTTVCKTHSRFSSCYWLWRESLRTT